MEDEAAFDVFDGKADMFGIGFAERESIKRAVFAPNQGRGKGEGGSKQRHHRPVNARQ